MNYELYKKLYARFLKRSPQQLIELAGYPRGRILDLCAGGGRLSNMLLESGYDDITAVDRDPGMISSVDPRVKRVTQEVSEFIDASDDNSYDTVFCQQGINYWFDPSLLGELQRIMMPGGRFVFNTFNTRPSGLSTHSYVIDDVRYVEVSWMDSTGMLVHHVQIMDGYPPDTQTFQWVSSDEFHGVLGADFYVEEEIRGRTSIYRCVSRKEK